MQPHPDPQHRAKLPTITVALSAPDRSALAELMRRGRSSARVFKRARVLQLLDEGKAPGRICEALGVSHTLVQRVGLRYRERGLAWALGEAPRPGVARRLSGPQAEQVLKLLQAPPPSGHARWSVRLLARHAVEAGIVQRVGRETIRELLQRSGQRPWRRRRLAPRAWAPGPETAPLRPPAW